MGFWDIFRKKEKEAEIEKISFNEIDSWLEKAKSENKEKEKQFLDGIYNSLSGLIKELEQKEQVLENFDVNTKKAEQKIRFIVEENLSHYLEHLNKLIAKLKELNEEQADVEKINSAFSYFEKKSSLSFQKATILIGKELGNVRESIKNFFKNLNKTLKENDSVVEKSKKLSSIENNLKKISEYENKINEIERKIKEYDQHIQDLKNKISSKQEQIKKIEDSEAYSAEKKKMQELEKNKEELEKMFSELKSSIDFKALANFYHSFEKEMSEVKNHRDNFRKEFEKNNQTILSLLKESKIINEETENKIKKVTEMQEKIKNAKIEDFGIKSIEKNISELKIKIEEIAGKKAADEKRKKKMQEETEELRGKIRGELVKIGVEVI